jgi:DNA-binding MarR family transcriptional regulator
MERKYQLPTINSLLHNVLRLKIMVALDSLESASFMYLCNITGYARGNISAQLKALQNAEYIKVKKSGSGQNARTVCYITPEGRKALKSYELGLRRLFAEDVPAEEEQKHIG